MTRIRILAPAALAAFLSVPPAAAAPAPAEYLVSMTLSQDGRTVATPSLTVRAGEPATFMKGERDYHVRVEAMPRDDSDVRIAADLVFWTPDGLQHQGATRTLRADGVPTSLAFTGIDAATTSDMAIEVRVRPLGE